MSEDFPTLVPVVTSTGPTSASVHLPAGSGLVEDWGGSVTVYVAQPQRPRVTDSEDFAALTRTAGGVPTRHDDRVTDAQYALAVQLLRAYDADPGAAERSAAARAEILTRRRAELTRAQRLVADKLTALRAQERALLCAADELTACAADPARAVPAVDWLTRALSPRLR